MQAKLKTSLSLLHTYTNALLLYREHDGWMCVCVVKQCIQNRLSPNWFYCMHFPKCTLHHACTHAPYINNHKLKKNYNKRKNNTPTSEWVEFFSFSYFDGFKLIIDLIARYDVRKLLFVTSLQTWCLSQHTYLTSRTIRCVQQKQQSFGNGV